MQPQKMLGHDSERRWERGVFLFLTVFLAPMLSAVAILGFGLVVWLWRSIAGVPELG
jgi:nitrate reductase NapE component